MSETEPSPVQRLRSRAERALAEGRRDASVRSWLESLTREADQHSEDALFAHRQLAELQLEEDPWQAALHLRQLVLSDAADDGVHALMGLCHALMGHYRAAVRSYRRALLLSPRNPWYQHNLGHLLDVGLDDAPAAVEHLREAHRIRAEEDEITASLAHCLARLGQVAEAREMAEDAAARSPRNTEHQALVGWLQDGAKHTGATPPKRRPPKGTGPNACEVERLLTRSMQDAGFDADDVDRALALWSDYRQGRQLRLVKPAVFAASVEYAFAKVENLSDVTQVALAQRYGIAVGSISNRYGQIRSALELIVGDPRYSTYPPSNPS